MKRWTWGQRMDLLLLGLCLWMVPGLAIVAVYRVINPLDTANLLVSWFTVMWDVVLCFYWVHLSRESWRRLLRIPEVNAIYVMFGWWKKVDYPKQLIHPDDPYALAFTKALKPAASAVDHDASIEERLSELVTVSMLLGAMAEREQVQKDFPHLLHIQDKELLNGPETISTLRYLGMHLLTLQEDLKKLQEKETPPFIQFTIHETVNT